MTTLRDEPPVNEVGLQSIDFSLELEHQLNSESLPSSPAPRERPQSMDTNVLASIVLQLRQSLTVATRERDELLDALGQIEQKKKGSPSEEAPLKEALQNMTDRCAKLQEELEVARQKIKDDEDAITMLRSKVEESRRGLMRLQTENRRMTSGGTSPLPLDLSRAGSMSTRDKRASFTPLTGSFLQNGGGHRRISSVSDSGTLTVPDLKSGLEPTSPAFSSTEHPSSHPPSSSRRFSGLFRGSPPLELTPSPDNHLVEQIEALKKELKSARDELEDTRHELTEANEAKEASETCVTVLRAFIDANNTGAQPSGAQLAPAPLKRAESSSSKASSSGWGFKLWKADVVSKPVAVPAPAPLLPAVSASPPDSTAPLSKIGGFFSSRGSASSTHSQTQAASLPHQPESAFNGSDTSSIVESMEPISPTVEGQTPRVVVRVSGSLSDDLTESPQGIKAFQKHSRDRSLETTTNVTS